MPSRLTNLPLRTYYGAILIRTQLLKVKMGLTLFTSILPKHSTVSYTQNLLLNYNYMVIVTRYFAG